MPEWLFFPILGAVAGLLSGLFGIGGGVLIVPSLAFILSAHQYPQEFIMHFATSTSLATMCFITFGASWAHIRKGAVQWPLFKILVPMTLLGAAIGIVFADNVPSVWLSKIFSGFLALVGLKMVFGFKPIEHAPIKSSKVQWASIGFGVGGVAAICGVGGGILLVPAMMSLKVPMRQAVATSVVCAFPTVCMATITAVLVSHTEVGFPAYTVGYVVWPAALIIGLTSWLFAPIGVNLAQWVPTGFLKKAFGGILLLVAWKMAFFGN